MQDNIIAVKLKENIKRLIEIGQLEDAKKLIESYKEIEPEDIEVYSIIGVVAIVEGKWKEAEEILLVGLERDSKNFDILYNLAYLYEQTEEYRKALQFYIKAEVYCTDPRLKDEIKTKVFNLSSNHGIKLEELNTVGEKKKIAFFSKGNDEFLNDIIQELSKEYQTKKITITKNEELKLIDQWMQWADVCWFEWCDELVIYGSKLPIAREKKIVCRLHRYEAFTDYPKMVNWENVDKLIIVTNHLKTLLNAIVPNIEKRVDIVTINNGVNLAKYTFKQRKPGYKLAYVGYIHQRKNPTLLLQVMEKLVRIDNRYKLYVAGQFQDSLIKLYWDYQIHKMKLDKNIIFEGWQNNIGEWLEDKNYLLSTSIHESFGYGIAEAMARGIKPVIHDFVFSEEIWDKKFLWNTVDEAVEMITDKDYNSQEYRNFIEKNYSFSKQMESIKNVISSLLNQVENKSEINLSSENITLDYIRKRLDEFIPYTCHDFDRFNFENAEIYLGKREKISDNYEVIEFILGNENEKLVLNNIWFDKMNNIIILPEQMRNSKNLEDILGKIRMIINYELRFDNNIAGFVFNKGIKEDIEKNKLAYIWERTIPASQFMPILGCLKIAERYIFAASFIDGNDKVLEAPCGFGYGAAYFSNLCKCVYALDIARENIDFGKDAYINKNNINWLQGDVTKLPFDNNEFDVYVSYEVLEHLNVNLIDKYFREAHRVIKKGGKFILSTPNIETRRHINNPFHIKEYSFEEFQKIIKSYFRKIEFYSISNYRVEKGMSKTAYNMIAVCKK